MVKFEAGEENRIVQEILLIRDWMMLSIADKFLDMFYEKKHLRNIIFFTFMLKENVCTNEFTILLQWTPFVRYLW